MAALPRDLKGHSELWHRGGETGPQSHSPSQASLAAQQPRARGVIVPPQGGTGGHSSCHGAPAQHKAGKEPSIALAPAPELLQELKRRAQAQCGARGTSGLSQGEDSRIQGLFREKEDNDSELCHRDDNKELSHGDRKAERTGIVPPGEGFRVT